MCVVGLGKKCEVYGSRVTREENNKARRAFVHITWVVTQCSCKPSLETLLHSGYPSICHNELRDKTGELMTKVYHNVSTEPTLQPITDEHLVHQKTVPDVAFGVTMDNVHFLT